MYMMTNDETTTAGENMTINADPTAATARVFAERIAKCNREELDIEVQCSKLAQGRDGSFCFRNAKVLTDLASKRQDIALRRKVTWGIARDLNALSEADLIGPIKGLLLRSPEGA